MYTRLGCLSWLRRTLTTPTRFSTSAVANQGLGRSRHGFENRHHWRWPRRLAAALFLKRTRHEATVYEQAQALHEVGAEIIVPPNMVRPFRRLGLASRFEDFAVRLEFSWEFRRWENGRVISVTTMDEECQRLYGAPCYVAHRADLRGFLRRELSDRRPQRQDHPPLPSSPVQNCLPDLARAARQRCRHRPGRKLAERIPCRELFERRREDGVGVGRAARRLVELRKRQRRAQFEAARPLEEYNTETIG